MLRSALGSMTANQMLIRKSTCGPWRFAPPNALRKSLSLPLKAAWTCNSTTHVSNLGIWNSPLAVFRLASNKERVLRQEIILKTWIKALATRGQHQIREHQGVAHELSRTKNWASDFERNPTSELTSVMVAIAEGKTMRR